MTLYVLDATNVKDGVQVPLEGKLLAENNWPEVGTCSDLDFSHLPMHSFIYGQVTSCWKCLSWSRSPWKSESTPKKLKPFESYSSFAFICTWFSWFPCAEMFTVLRFDVSRALVTLEDLEANHYNTVLQLCPRSPLLSGRWHLTMFESKAQITWGRAKE